MVDIEEIWSIFDQVKHVVSHIESHIPEKLIIPKNTGEAIKGSQEGKPGKNIYL